MIALKNDQDVVEQVPTGFSWTTLFFSFFVPIFRGDTRGIVLQLIWGIITSGASVVWFACYYNKMYIKQLYRAGFKPTDDDSEKYLVVNDIIPYTQN